MRSLLVGTACVLCGLAVPGISHSQAVAAPKADPGSARPATPAVEDIVITAQKRKERLQSVAVSAVSLQAALLTRNNVSDISDLSRLVPSVNIETNTTGRAPYSVRGVSTPANEANVGLSSGVAVLIDGVPVPSDSHSADQIEDVQRIEVLKGPQATLGGRTAAGGMINIVTNGPTDRLTGAVGTSFTTDGEKRGNFTIAGPINNSLAFSLSGYDNHVNYPQKNITDDKDTQVDNQGFRGKLRYTVSNDLTITLAGHYAHDHSYGDNLVYTYIAPGSSLLFPGSPLTQALELGSIQPHYGNRLYTSVAQNIGGVYTDRDISLVIDYNLGALDVTSTTALQRDQQKNVQDLFGVDNYFFNVLTQGSAPPFYNSQTIRNDEKQVSEELRVASPTTDRFNYLAGVFFSKTDISSNFFRDLAPAATDYTAKPITSTYDVYGRANYKLTPKLTIVTGLRFNYDDLKYTDDQIEFAPFSPFGGSNPYYSSGHYAAGAIVGDVSAQYFLTSRNMFYATYARGYSPSAYNVAAPLDSNGSHKPVARMDINHFEVGSKGTYFDRRLLVNASAFYTRYDNYQIQTTGDYPGLLNPPLVLANAPQVQTHGLELDATARPTDGLTLNFNVAYIDATFVDWHTAPCPFVYLTASCLQNVDGKSLPNAPKLKFVLDAAQEIPLTFLNSSIVLGGTYTYRTSAEMLADQNPYAKQPAYGLLNLNVGWDLGGGRYAVTAFVNNVFNKIYYTDVEDFFSSVWANPVASDAVVAQVGRDAHRYAGIRLTAKF